MRNWSLYSKRSSKANEKPVQVPSSGPGRLPITWRLAVECFFMMNFLFWRHQNLCACGGAFANRHWFIAYSSAWIFAFANVMSDHTKTHCSLHSRRSIMNLIERKRSSKVQPIVESGIEFMESRQWPVWCFTDIHFTFTPSHSFYYLQFTPFRDRHATPPHTLRAIVPTESACKMSYFGRSRAFPVYAIANLLRTISFRKWTGRWTACANKLLLVIHYYYHQPTTGINAFSSLTHCAASRTSRADAWGGVLMKGRIRVRRQLTKPPFSKRASFMYSIGNLSDF